jgi:AbrB family looped-hinge helix DNA binding protein
MPTSTISRRGRTTVPKEVRDALNVGPGDRLSWEVRGGRVAITTERPGLWRWEGIFKDGPADAVQAVKEARKRRGRI